jgi:hypothetical protein
MFVFYYDVLILKIKKIKNIYFNIFLNKIYIYIYIYKPLHCNFWEEDGTVEKIGFHFI